MNTNYARLISTEEAVEGLRVEHLRAAARAFEALGSAELSEDARKLLTALDNAMYDTPAFQALYDRGFVLSRKIRVGLKLIRGL
jgi:hypothetical protein